MIIEEKARTVRDQERFSWTKFSKFLNSVGPGTKSAKLWKMAS